MTEWIIILVVGVIVAAAVGFLLGKKQHTQVTPTTETEQHENIVANSSCNANLETKYRAVLKIN